MAAPVSPQYPKTDPKFKEYWTSTRTDVGIYNNNYSPGRYFSSRDLNLLNSVSSE